MRMTGNLNFQAREQIVPLYQKHRISSKRLGLGSFYFMTFISIQKFSVPPISPLGCCHGNMQLFCIILKTRISVVFQVYPPERNLLWGNILCFGHHNTLRSLMKAHIRSATEERFQKIVLLNFGHRL